LNKFQTPLLAIAAIVSLFFAAAHELAASGPDYCAMANARTCKVGDHGEWTTLTMPDGSSALVLTKSGRVVQVLR
jgi:hypothetical protein